MKRADKGQIELGGTDAAAGTFLKFISFIIGQNPKPDIIKCARREGDLTYSIPTIGFGKDEQSIRALRRMLSARFYADFAGELVMRSNAQQFHDHIADDPFYENDVAMWRHEHCGVAVDSERIYFIVHVSCLCRILNERFGE